MANIFFFYEEKFERFGMGVEVGTTILMGATQSNNFNKDTWLSRAHAKYPFDRAIGHWFNIIPGSIRTLSGGIRFRCVDEDFVICESRKLAFDQVLAQKTTEGTLVYTNIPGQDYYEQLPNVFNENRPVFESRNGSMTFRLYYNSYQQGWVVGDEYPSFNVFMIAKDKAWSPEYITNGWTYYTDGRLQNIDARLRCLGLSELQGKNCNASNDTCQNGGRCHQLTDGKEVCLCVNDGFNGVTCEKTKPRCPVTTSLKEYKDVIGDGNYVGSIGTFFCQNGYEPEYIFGVCEADSAGSSVGHWKHKQKCSLITTTTKATTILTTPRPTRPPTTQWSMMDWHERNYERRRRERYRRSLYWVYGVTIAIALIVPFVLPAIIWYILYKISEKLDEKHANFKLKQLNHQNRVLADAGRRLDDELAQGKITTEEFQEEKGKAVEEFTAMGLKDREIRQEMKSKRLIKNISISRGYSIAFSVGFWIWIPGLVLHNHVEIESYAFSEVLRGLYPCAITHIVLGAIWVLGESYFSREYGYLSKLGDSGYASDYLKSLRETAPHLVMRAECYHYETRTRVVTYTDGNGNLNTRLETYTVRVVTHSDAELFRYSYWVDNSKERLEYNETYGVTKIKLKNSIIAGDSETRELLDAAQAAFRERNRDIDEYMDYQLDITVDGFEKRMASYTDPSRKSWWIKKRYFWLATFLTFTWPYRWLFRARTGRAKYKVEKSIYIRHPEESGNMRNIVAYDVSSEQQSELVKAKGDEDSEYKTKDESEKGSRRRSLMNSIKEKTNKKDDKEKKKKGKGKEGKEVVLDLGDTPVNKY